MQWAISSHLHSTAEDVIFPIGCFHYYFSRVSLTLVEAYRFINEGIYVRYFSWNVKAEKDMYGT